jgi:hypothetical protein
LFYVDALCLSFSVTLRRPQSVRSYSPFIAEFSDALTRPALLDLSAPIA